MYFFVLAVLVAVVAAHDFDCNQFNNDCTSCIQAAFHVAYQCTFCPVDGVCHTIGSLTNKCTNDECVSLSDISTCNKKDVASCDNLQKLPWSNETKKSDGAVSNKPPYRMPYSSSSCTGPHEFCCEAPNEDPNNCPDSARTSDCDKKKSCCCA